MFECPVNIQPAIMKKQLVGQSLRMAADSLLDQYGQRGAAWKFANSNKKADGCQQRMRDYKKYGLI